MKRWYYISDKKYVKGYMGKTQSGDEYVVLDYTKGIITIEFIKTGYQTKVTSSKLIRGNIRDRLKPSLCGVGYLGHNNSIGNEQEYSLWKGIIERCYRENIQDYKNYGNKGITVCERWKCFSNFLEDIKNIEGYDEGKFKNNRLDLDKDIKQKNLPANQKMYSPDTCMFVDKSINRAIITRKRTPDVNIISTKGDYVLKTFCPVEELSKQIGVRTQYITRILRGEAKTHQVWTFKYE